MKRMTQSVREAASIPGWTTKEELFWLYEQAKKMRNIVEVGSWKGRSTYALLAGNFIGFPNGTVYAVDHFNGSKEHRWFWQTRNLYATFIHNVGYFPNCRVVRKDSLEAAKEFKDKAIDMVFIDGGHSYQEVCKDSEAWASIPRRLLCFHDYATVWRGVTRAINDCLGPPTGKVGTIWFKEIR